MKVYLIILTLCLFSILSCSHHLPDFTTHLSTRLPTTQTTEAIGEYSSGCLNGAQTFLGSENGLVLSKMKRGRYWGHPDLIKLLTNAGLHFNRMQKKIIIGDLSQSRGGPTLSGHNSHQTGLDVDVWFKIIEANAVPNLSTIETEEMKAINEIGEDQVKLIKYFINDASVDRIFINPSFKKKLCSDTSSQKLSIVEQHKLRAWWGHDDHIHIRLKCPIDSPKCISQKPVPLGDGCGEELNWWFTDEARTGNKDDSWDEMKAAYLTKINRLPKDCSFYINSSAD